MTIIIHFLKHGSNFHKVDTDPAEGEIDPETLSNRCGRRTYCEKCEAELMSSLKKHYISIHIQGHTPSAKTYDLTDIPVGYNGPAEKIRADTGFCGICNKVFRGSLRNHYIVVHLKETEPCSVCGDNINFGGLVSHMLTHSGPVKSSQDDCDAICESKRAFQSHKSRNHSGERGVTFLLLNETEKGGIFN